METKKKRQEGEKVQNLNFTNLDKRMDLEILHSLVFHFSVHNEDQSSTVYGVSVCDDAFRVFSLLTELDMNVFFVFCVDGFCASLQLGQKTLYINTHYKNC